MAGKGGRELFRKKSLERLSSPERLDQLLEVVDRKSWVPLATVGLLVLGLLAWAVFAKIPVNVEGKGILVRPRQISEFQAPGGGRVVRIAIAVGDSVRRGQLLAEIERPDLEEQLRLQKQKAAELTAQSRAASERTGGAEGVEEELLAEGPSLRDHIERSRELARTLRGERLAVLGEEEQRLDEQQQVARELSQALRERFEGRRRLTEEGLVSKTELDAAEEAYMDSLERLYEIETQRGKLETARLEADELYFDRLQKIAEWSFELEQQIADVHREIARLALQIEEECRVVSDHDGRIIEINAVPGTILASGDRLGAMEVRDPTSTLKSVTYFRVKDGKRLREGMPIHVTPDTVERERFGSIRGVVRTVSSFPVSVDEAASVVGNRIVAQTLIEGGYLIEVASDLQRSPARPDRYDWTSSKGPEEVEVTAGTTTTARVAVERERPIAFVLPLLKSAAGID
jgi:HlyD family secretion protein